MIVKREAEILQNIVDDKPIFNSPSFLSALSKHLIRSGYMTRDWKITATGQAALEDYYAAQKI